MFERLALFPAVGDELVDVLQRIAIHPDSHVEDLTPRRWKKLFAHDPLRSKLELVSH